METSSYTHDTNKMSYISSIGFRIYGGEEIKRQSVFTKNPDGITVADLYQEMEPKKFGLIDPALGTTDSNAVCTTCKLKSSECPGHFAHIRLVEPVFDIGYLDYVQKILSCICLKCSEPLFDIRNKEVVGTLLNAKLGSVRFNLARSLIKNVTSCKLCGTAVPKIKVEIKKQTNEIKIIAINKLSSDTEDKNKKIITNLSAKKCQEIFTALSDDTCLLLGLDPNKSHPKWMIIDNLPVPPVPVRPTSKGDFIAAASREDQLTHKLADIIKYNNRLRKIKESASSGDKNMGFLDEHYTLMQYHVATYENNESSRLQTATQHNMKVISLVSRLSGKEGRIRGNLEGKRVDYSGRTVITPDPTLDINQIGIPLKVAMNLTFPESVTEGNIEYLTTLVRNGREKYPGANYVFPGSRLLNPKDSDRGKTISPIDLKYQKDKIILKVGDIVERHLIDGDILLCNRQPTLHKVSMMGHSAKIIKNPDLISFRLPLAVCEAYNADFDGDEMNIFPPQSPQTKIELEELTDVKRQIISSASSMPIIGVRQDGVFGMYNLTKDQMIDRKSAMNILISANIDDYSKFQNKEHYSGLEIASVFLPQKINKEWKTCKIENGVFKQGYIIGDMIGVKNPDTITQIVWDEYGVDEAKKLLDNLQRVANNYNIYSGFTVNFDDVVPKKEIYDKVMTIINTKKLKIAHVISEYENHPDMYDKKLFESIIYSEMNSILGDVSKVLINNVDSKNGLGVMINSKAKGGETNLGQMSGCIGLQSFEGTALMPKRVNGRTLPYYFQNDDNAEARGFIEKSFLKGQNYKNFFFHNFTSREGLINAAVRTADTGYIQRKFIKTMEDILVAYDGTIRNDKNEIIQYVYGSTGADPSRQYGHYISLLEKSNEDVNKIYKFTADELKQYNDFDENKNQQMIKDIIGLRDIGRNGKIRSILDAKIFDTSIGIPVNLNRIINNAKKSTEKGGKLTPTYVLERIEYILDKTVLIPMKDHERNNKKSIKKNDEMISKTGLHIAIAALLYPRRCIIEYKLNKSQFDKIVDEIIENYNKNIIEPGEMIGILASQSITEPLTQMTLKSFHHSGIGSKSVANLGVPRIRELISVSNKQKTPIMEISLDKKYRNDKNMANKIASQLRYTTINDIVTKIDVYYDPQPYEKGGFMDVDHIYDSYYDANKKCNAKANEFQWMVRMKINREKMLEYEITMIDIKSKFCHLWNRRDIELNNVKRTGKNILNKITRCALFSNNDNDKNPMLHLRFDMNPFDVSILDEFITLILEKFKLKGINGISKAAVEEEQMITFDEQTGEKKNGKQYIIYTDGVNCDEIKKIKNIDHYWTQFNDINAIYEAFGIEAVRTILVKEYTTVFQTAGSKVIYQHIATLCDLMTHSGAISSIDRHGMSKSSAGPLTRASFEQSTEQFLSAAVFGEVDPMNSVSARIITGAVIKGGTGLCDIEMDDKIIDNSEYNEEFEDISKTYVDISGDNLIKDMMGKETKGFIPE